MLRCKVCSIEKDREICFYRTSGHVCKECKKKRTNNKSVDEMVSMVSLLAINDKKICNTCDIPKSTNEFYTGRKICKECYSKRRLASNKTNTITNTIINASDKKDNKDGEFTEQLIKMVSVYIKDHHIRQKCVGDIKDLLQDVDKYIFALNAEHYPEGFTRTSVFEYHQLSIMSVISLHSNNKKILSKMPKNYYDYTIQFYHTHKDKYSLEYPN